MTEEILKLLALPTIQKQRGTWQQYDRYYCPNMKKVYRRTSNISFCCDADKHLWFPPVYDEEQPERGLIGMVKGFEQLGTDDGCWYVSWYLQKEEHLEYENSLIVALLKAIWAQELLNEGKEASDEGWVCLYF